MKISKLYLFFYSSLFALTSGVIFFIAQAAWLKIILFLVMLTIYLHTLFTDILSPQNLPTEYELRYAKIWRYVLIIKLYNSVSRKKCTHIFFRDQFTLMQWKDLRRKIRFYKS